MYGADILYIHTYVQYVQSTIVHSVLHSVHLSQGVCLMEWTHILMDLLYRMLKLRVTLF